MIKRATPYDLLCRVERLMAAWRRVRANRGVAGIDRMSIAEYERDLHSNLEDLSARLSEGRYYPMPVRATEMRKRDGSTRTLGILTIEDRLVQRAALEAIEPLFEPAFLDCSFGFRPGRSVEMAVQRVLDYRAAGDLYVVDADIADCFAGLDHNILMKLVSARVRDKRMLALIRMWLDCGEVLPARQVTHASAPLVQKLTSYVGDSVNAAILNLLDDGGYTRTGYGWAGDSIGVEIESGSEPEAEAYRRARSEALKRLGRDGALLALTYVSRARKIFSPAGLAFTGAAVVVSAAYPLASKAVRQWLGPGGRGAVQGGSLSPLLCNIYLHEFDREMISSGLHLVRYADDFVILCPDEAQAQAALAQASQRLADLKLRLNPQKTSILRFDAGLEFLGYGFDRLLAKASPLSPRNTRVAALLGSAREKAAPGLLRLSEKAGDGLRAGAARVRAALKVPRQRRKDDLH